MNALVIIDMQDAYFRDRNLSEQKHALVDAIQNQINISISNNDLIINVKTLHSRGKKTWTLNMLEDNQGFLFSGSPESNTLVTLPNDAIEVHKTRDSAFHDTNLINILKNKEVQQITLVGVSAHSCIFHTAAAAYAYNIKVTLLSKAIGDEDKEAMNQAFEYLTREYRQDVF